MSFLQIILCWKNQLQIIYVSIVALYMSIDFSVSYGILGCQKFNHEYQNIFFKGGGVINFFLLVLDTIYFLSKI